MGSTDYYFTISALNSGETLKSLITLLALCTALVTTAEAQSQPAAADLAPGYLLVLGRSTDRPKIIAYSSQLPPIYSATGGRYIGQGRPGAGAVCVYGFCEGRSAVIAHWADYKKIDAFWWGEAYRKVGPMRDGAGVFTVVGVRGVADVQPFSAGALLISTMNSNSTGSNLAPAQTWLTTAIASAGARLLTPFSNGAITSLEGDALYNTVALLHFESKEKRDAFTASESTQTFIKNMPPLSLIAIIGVDSPPAQPLATPAKRAPALPAAK